MRSVTSATVILIHWSVEVRPNIYPSRIVCLPQLKSVPQLASPKSYVPPKPRPQTQPLTPHAAVGGGGVPLRATNTPSAAAAAEQPFSKSAPSPAPLLLVPLLLLLLPLPPLLLHKLSEVLCGLQSLLGRSSSSRSEAGRGRGMSHRQPAPAHPFPTATRCCRHPKPAATAAAGSQLPPINRPEWKI